jgi:hypothetical protein
MDAYSYMAVILWASILASCAFVATLVDSLGSTL